MDIETRNARVAMANRAIEIIASHGRKFFSLHADGRKTEEPERLSRFELRQNGRLFFIDKYTQRPIYVAYRLGRWRGFSDGGTLRALVEELADWINGKCNDFPLNHLGPWPEWICGGDLWGYGEEMAKVREQITELLKVPLAKTAT
jgi:hypothetical protein